MNFESARAQMLTQQIRAWEVLDDRVLRTLHDVPREQFVPGQYRELAFADTEIPIGHGQKTMAPKVEGRLLQALQIERSDEVLEVGTGSGYLTACLARLGGRVTSAEIFEDLAASAEARLAERETDNVDVQVADALTLQFEDRFDAIAVTGSLPELNDHFIRMLRPRGRLFVIIGRAPVMEARLITRQSGGQWTELSLFETVLDPLINAEQPEPFVL